MKTIEIVIIFLNLCILGVCIAILTTKKEWFGPPTQASKLYGSWKKNPIVGGKRENYSYQRNEPKNEVTKMLLGQKQACNAYLA